VDFCTVVLRYKILSFDFVRGARELVRLLRLHS
jgi:hypothetical protein